LRFGERILRIARLPIMQALLIGLVALCLAGSAVSVYGWIRRIRT